MRLDNYMSMWSYSQVTERCRTFSSAAIERIAARFRVLGEPLRLRLVDALREGGRSVSELAAALEASQPNVSKHLRLLQAEGVVGRRQEGNLAYYFIADPGVVDLCNAVCASVGERLARDADVAAELMRVPRRN